MKAATVAGTRNLYADIEAVCKSIVAHSSVDRIYVLCEDERAFDAPPFVEFIDVSGQNVFRPDGPNANSVFTYMAMMRVMYAELFPELDTIVQFDADAFAVDCIDELWDMDLQGKWLAATRENQTFHNPYGAVYYNIGVSVFNLAQMRIDNAITALVNTMNSEKLWCVEQDALNMHGARQGKFADLPLRFNESKPTGYTDNPAVVHFASFGTNWMDREDAPRREMVREWYEKSWKDVIHG